MRKWIEELYNDLGTSFGISPEILMMLNQTKGAILFVRDYFNSVETLKLAS